MMRLMPIFTAVLLLVSARSALANEPFPPELVRFQPTAASPVFTAGEPDAWDARIRERGWILNEGDTWKLWYTGYDGTRAGQKKLGYATSPDGVTWTRHAGNPIYDEHWVEDMMIVKHDGTYYMFAEGEADQAELLRSPDGREWTRVGPLDIRLTNGRPLSEGPRGTPTAWYENGTWHLFYERYDKGIWLATSTDMQTWTNLSDAPVIEPGPDEYDRLMVALNQIIKRDGRYYAYYHGSGSKEKPRLWSPAIAVSDDLIHWTKYAGNPLRPPAENKSSGIVVPTAEGDRFYTMHERMDLFTSPGAATPGLE